MQCIEICIALLDNFPFHCIRDRSSGCVSLSAGGLPRLVEASALPGPCFPDTHEQSCLLTKACRILLLLLQEPSWWERPTWISLLLGWWEPGPPLALPQTVLTPGAVSALQLIPLLVFSTSRTCLTSWWCSVLQTHNAIVL